MKGLRVGGHPQKYWRGRLPFLVKNEAQSEDLWNAMSKEFTGTLAMMVFPREWNRASGRELHFKLSSRDNDRYIELGKEIGTLIGAYLSTGESERRIFQRIAQAVLGQ
jgi:hypothetical protein